MAGMSAFTRATFAFIVALQVLFVLVFVTDAVSTGIAGERERKTLDALLSTRLSSAEVVVGITAAGLGRFLSALAAFLPVMVLFVAFGGVDPRLVLLTYAGIASTTLAVAGISVACSPREFRPTRSTSCES